MGNLEPSEPSGRTEQALGLLESALDALREAPATDAFPRDKVARLVMSARARFATAGDPNGHGFASNVLACNELLDDALNLAGKHAATSEHHVRAISAIERSQAILYFVAFRGPDGTPEGRPLSIRPRARSSHPPEPPAVWSLAPPGAEPGTEMSLAECSPEQFDALLRGEQPAPEPVTTTEPEPTQQPNPTEEPVAAEAPAADDDDDDEPELEVGSLPPDALDDQLKPSASSTEPPPKAPRLALAVRITLGGPTNFYLGFEEDISSGGLFVATYNRPRVGTLITLGITLPSGYVAQANGTVSWTRDVLDPDDDSIPGVGIKLEELSAEAHAAITAFTRVRAPMFHDDES